MMDAKSRPHKVLANAPGWLLIDCAQGIHLAKELQAPPPVDGDGLSLQPWLPAFQGAHAIE